MASFVEGYLGWARANAELRGLVLDPGGGTWWWVRPVDGQDWEAGSSEQAVFVGPLPECVEAVRQDLRDHAGEAGAPWLAPAEQRLDDFLRHQMMDRLVEQAQELDLGY